VIYQDTIDSNFEGETAKPTWSIVILDGIQITSWFDMLKGKGLMGARRLYLCGCCSADSSGIAGAKAEVSRPDSAVSADIVTYKIERGLLALRYLAKRLRRQGQNFNTKRFT
jgi:hypothetical protein